LIDSQPTKLPVGHYVAKKTPNSRRLGQASILRLVNSLASSVHEYRSMDKSVLRPDQSSTNNNHKLFRWSHVAINAASEPTVSSRVNYSEMPLTFRPEDRKRPHK
jgi:hypothetical protein